MRHYTPFQIKMMQDMIINPSDYNMSRSKANNFISRIANIEGWNFSTDGTMYLPMSIELISDEEYEAIHYNSDNVDESNDEDLPF